MGATKWAKGVSEFSTEIQLALYGCYKQATVGDNPAGRPWGMEASYKWSAWNEHRGCSRTEAMLRYIRVLTEVAPQWREGIVPEDSGSDEKGQGGGMSMGPAV